ncbi:hypothetical protein [Nocardia nepalensis]|uniref:hypothetical protein n=1 Tax=Nocardia nepalensis TaxID=3375448 RepID=UPI003B670767
MPGKTWGLVLGALGTIGVGAWVFVRLGLDKGDKLASVLGLFVGLAGLGVAIYGVVQGVRNSRALATRSSIGGAVSDVGEVKSDLTINTQTPNPLPPTLPPGTPPTGGEADAMVSDSWVGGSVRRIRKVGGKLEINE